MANIHNFENKNENAEEIYMPFVSQPQTWPEYAPRANYADPHNPQNPQHLLPYLHPIYTYSYQHYFNQFVPYIYGLINPAVNCNLSHQSTPPTKMDIETYINYELNKQRSLMHNQNPRPRILSQLQLPTTRSSSNKKKQEQQRRIINVEVVAMAGSTRESVKVQDDIEPLPPVTAEFRASVAKIAKSQQHYTQLFGRLTNMLQTLSRRYDGNEPEPEEQQQQLTVVDAPPPPPKRARHDMSSSSCESHLDVENSAPPAMHAQYPLRVKMENGSSIYVLGPHGTQINAKDYSQVFWTSAPIATRCLLAAVFTSDELATHTLTGKPSPAFYGRERPAKKMLDQHRVDDIIVSVRNRTGGKERHIRATITTKCADTAKKYKRRAKKAVKDNVDVKEESV